MERGVVSALRPRRALELRISVTERCQLRCVYCAPPRGEPTGGADEVLAFGAIARFVRVMSSAFEVTKVHLTGGEPLLRAGLPDLVADLAAASAADLALTTNGQLLADAARDLRRAGLRRVNVSLDSLDADTYEALGRGGRVERTIRGIDEALHAGLAPVKINAVILRGRNDHEVVDLARFALERGATVRFLELMPIGCAAPLFETLFVPASEMRARLADAFALRPLRQLPGRTSRDFLAVDRAGRRGVVGFIAAETERFCAGCARIRLTSSGRILRCLARSDGPRVGPLLESDSPEAARDLLRIVAGELDRKRARGSFAEAPPMLSVGG